MNECKCGAEGTEEYHPCPYSQDVDGDNSDTCNCCDDCQNACADEI